MNIADTWIQTNSGHAFPLLNPTPADVRLSDIVESLAKKCRWNGAPQVQFSVLQHSCDVHDLLSGPAKPYGLFHDAHEFGGGDMSRPFFKCLSPTAQAEVIAIKDDIDRAIFTAMGLQWPMPPDIAALVAHADDVALATEQRDIMAQMKPGQPRHNIGKAPASRCLKPWSWPRAVEEFMNRVQDLAIQGLINPEVVA